MLLLVEICNSINPTRALALFGESVKGNVEWGWEVPKLSKLFAKIVTKKTSINDFGIRSSWYGHTAKGHDKAMWIHPKIMSLNVLHLMCLKMNLTNLIQIV